MSLFTQIKTQSIPDEVDVLQTSGHSKLGIGAALYSVGKVGSTTPETPFSTNTTNGRPVLLIEDRLTIDMFGAVPDPSVNSYNAIQAAIDYRADRAGGDVNIPAAGEYMIGQSLIMKNNVTLRGQVGLLGGSGKILCTGSAFLSYGNLSGFNGVVFNLHNVYAAAAQKGVTNFLDRPVGGTWQYSIIEGCDFVNFKVYTLILTGSHFFNNNFQNAKSIVCQGSDGLFIGNYANIDEFLTVPSSDSFWKFQSATAMDFSHNYLTSFHNSSPGPAALELDGVGSSRVTGNQLDGGSSYCLKITNGSSQVVVTDNRLNTQGSFGRTGYLPLLLSNVTDIAVSNNWAANLEANAPWVRFESVNLRNILRDNILNTREQTTDHDYAGIAPGSIISMTGFGIPGVASVPHLTPFYSPHFSRLWINGSLDNPCINYVDFAAVKAGTFIQCYRSDLSKRWIIFDQRTNVAIYDSDVTASRSFTLFAAADQQLALRA